ncbi:MAG: hypothetical protein K6C97_00260 [Treponema sp.]|nr:hypothetical protein [Treponema sp.]
MNKKSLLVMVLGLIMSASIFAAATDTYKVKKVTGKVTYEATPGNWKNVSVGQELSASTVLNTSLNSSVVIALDDDDITIKAMQKGTVDSLVSASSGVAKKGIKKGLKTKSVGDEVTGSSKGTATASSRASEAKEDVDWDE